MGYAAARYLTVVVGCALVVGCSNKERDLISISGKATYRGKVVPGGTILLQPSAGRAIVAAIDETGGYQAAVPAGDYKVAVVSSAPIPEGVDPWKGNIKLPPPLVPEKFGRTETSGKSITVVADATEKPTIDIDLQ